MVSGGKDSLALLHLTHGVAPDTPAYFIDCGAETPWTYAVLRRLRQLEYPIETVATAQPLMSMLKRVGWQGYSGPEREYTDRHWTRADLRWWLIDEPAARIRALGYPVHLLGLRAGESRGRLKNYRRRGWLYERRDGAVIAAPLADWTGADVLAYCLAHDLPLSEVYLQPDDPAREQRRTAAALLTYCVAYGGAWRLLRAEQPAFWQELVRDFPQIARQA